MTARDIAEYNALRATIRERGTLRVWIAWTGLIAWAALAVATAALGAIPAAALLPLLVLGAAFEIVYSLHTAVERIGRYIQVFYEDDEPGETAARWETTIMAFGRESRSTTIDPLFSVIFWSAIALNFAPVLLAGPEPVEWVVVGLLHGAVAARMALARRQAARQRALDLEIFRRLKVPKSPQL
jgi:hypothetical protein